MRANLVLALAGLLAAPSALAHPGHGRSGEGYGLLHHLSEPEHVLVLFLLLAALIGAGLCLRPAQRDRSRR